MMKSLLAAILFLFAVSPAYAAYNNVSLTTSTAITVGSDTVNVSGSTAAVQSLDVYASSFGITLNSDTGVSTVTLTSPAGKQIVASPSSYVSSDSCSTITLTGSGGESTVTLGIGDICSTNQGNGHGGGGGGGGGSQRPRTPAPPPPAPPVNLPARPSGLNAVFSGDLSAGMSGADVLRLQALFMTRPDLFPGGSVSGFFGPLTQGAVQKFQVAYGVALPGAPGYGRVGPATRAKLLQVFGGTTVPAAPTQPSTPAVSGVPATISFAGGTLSKGLSSPDVLLVQKILNSDPATAIALTGPGSKGNETGTFGGLTEQAVQKFQVKYGISGPGLPGYGLVGPATKAKLQTIH